MYNTKIKKQNKELTKCKRISFKNANERTSVLFVVQGARPSTDWMGLTD